MKKIATLLIALLAIGMVSALLVSYLSDKAEVEVVVSSPMANTVVGDSVFGVFGGETVSVNIKTENLANVSVTGRVENLVSNPLGLNCGDFTSVIVSAYTDTVFQGTWDLVGTCYVVNATSVGFLFGPQPTNTWIAGQIDEMEIVVTFPTNAFGTYSLTSQILI